MIITKVHTTAFNAIWQRVSGQMFPPKEILQLQKELWVFAGAVSKDECLNAKNDK